MMVVGGDDGKVGWEGEMTATTLDFCWNLTDYFASAADKSKTRVGRTLLACSSTYCPVGGSGPSANQHVTGLSFDWPDN